MIKYADELIALVGALYFTFHFYKLRFSKSLKCCILFFGIYASLGLLSNINNATDFLPAWVQLFLDLKIFALILLLYYTGKDVDISKWMINFSKIILIFNIPLLIFQFLDPDAYFSVLGGKFERSGGLQIGSHIYQRGIGVFWHPSQLAIFTCFTIYVLLQLKVKKIWIVLASAQLLCTFQRQEIFTLIVGLLLASMMFPIGERAKMRPVKILFSTVLLVIFGYTFVSILSESLSDYVSMDFRGSDDPRIVFFVKAFPLATGNFPLGNGFGTFGGYSAFLFDSSLYHRLGFDYYYWYREGAFMTDTFYPHILAESGYIGCICYIFSIIYLFKYLSENLTVEGKKACFFSCFYLLFSALTAPIMNDALSIILFATVPFMCNKKNIRLKFN
jgi:hypothetical protein